jgi:predicted house-cleaning noncanonical NTP pyrophosphatase (MazG superfamily)
MIEDIILIDPTHKKEGNGGEPEVKKFYEIGKDQLAKLKEATANMKKVKQDIIALDSPKLRHEKAMEFINIAGQDKKELDILASYFESRYNNDDVFIFLKEDFKELYKQFLEEINPIQFSKILDDKELEQLNNICGVTERFAQWEKINKDKIEKTNSLISWIRTNSYHFMNDLSDLLSHFNAIRRDRALDIPGTGTIRDEVECERIFHGLTPSDIKTLEFCIEDSDWNFWGRYKYKTKAQQEDKFKEFIRKVTKVYKENAAPLERPLASKQ